MIKTPKVVSRISEWLGVSNLDEWRQISPLQVMQAEGIGPKSLDTLRRWLAEQGTTLHDDATPEAWLDAFSSERAPYPSDFIVLVDRQEKNPFTFAGIHHDADRDYRPMAVQTRVVSLGASHADYSVAGFEGRIAIERKSLEDAQSTFFSYGERRERFERELAYLASIESSAIIVECTRGELYGSVESRGRRTEKELARNLQRSLIAWEQDYRVPFVFCDSRKLAEVECFRRLQRFHRHAMNLSQLIASL